MCQIVPDTLVALPDGSTQVDAIVDFQRVKRAVEGEVLEAVTLDTGGIELEEPNRVDTETILLAEPNDNDSEHDQQQRQQWQQQPVVEREATDDALPNTQGGIFHIQRLLFLAELDDTVSFGTGMSKIKLWVCPVRIFLLRCPAKKIGTLSH